MKEIWILGGTGRSGRGIAKELLARGMTPVLVGRDAARLKEAAGKLPGTVPTIVAASLEASLEDLSRSNAAVVVNTVGPFSATGVSVARACPNGTHYVDISNELFGTRDMLALSDEAAAAGKTWVPGAGFGFVGTEAIVRKLCQGRPTPERVRVDPIPFVAGESDRVGESLAATIVDGLVGGMWHYAGGKLERAKVGSDPMELVVPDGRRLTTSCMPTGDLEAAHHATGAPFVVAASPMAPTGLVARAGLSVLISAVGWRPLRSFMTRRLANMRVPAAKEEHATWGHARVEWADGTVREGWMRAGDAMGFYFRTAAEVATRLAKGEGKPGAYTPCELFGPELAEAVGGVFQL